MLEKKNTIMLIQFGKKDDVLKEWFQYVSTQGVNASQLVMQAILYHYYTGKYMPLGTVTGNSEKCQNYKQKNIYFRETDDFLNILSEWKEEKKKRNTEIKRILSRGIRLDSICSLPKEEDCYDLLDEAKKQFHKGILDEKTIFEENKDVSIEKRERQEITKTKEAELSKEEINATSVPENSADEEEIIDREKDFVLSLIPPGCGLGG